MSVATIGCSGHRDALPTERSKIRDVVTDLHAGGARKAVCSLAGGVDQWFAAEALTCGWGLDVVIPFAGFREQLAGVDSYDELLGQAAAVTVLPYSEPCDEAFMATGIVIVERSTLLLAFWDGEPARGLGGTADVFAYAQNLGRPTRHVPITRM